MNTRRDALRILALTSAALPAFPSEQETQEVGSQPGHLHAGPTIPAASHSGPTVLQAAEFETLEALSEQIIPRSDTPGAKDAGVALLIDKAIASEPMLVLQYRAGLADVDAAARESYGQAFHALREEQQISILTRFTVEPLSPSGKFFALVKDMTVDAYYKTEAGLKTELGWHGNTYLPNFPGCDHPEHQG